MKYILTSWIVHVAGFLLFFVAWVGTFGSEPRAIPASLDIWLPIGDLFVTGVTTATLSSIATFQALRESKWVVAFLGWVTAFFGCAWVYAACLILEII